MPSILSFDGSDLRGRRLTLSQVREIRASRLASKLLAARFGVSINTIRRVRRGITWADF